MKPPSVLAILGIALPSGVAGAVLAYVAATHGYPVDWDATGTMLQGEAAILGAAAAVWGVNQWRKELRYKRNSELAVQVMVAVEGLVRNMKDARRAPEAFEIDREHGDRVLHSFSYSSRLAALKSKDYAAELAGLSNHVAAIFGEKHRKAIDGLVAIHFTVLNSYQQTITLREAAGDTPPMKNAYRLIDQISAILFPGADGQDGIGKGIVYAADEVRGLFKSSM
ncbi:MULTISPECIES: hypothetical protein [unclassified Stenotrophomonas]|uniref:hypothetical protein n=1 Tax=unclassified Stenotrophomonas TaxID=196198 RepID=UPI003466E7CA